jgi:hydroxyethylthiazole kinase-like uncharacterized protein yjeF
MLDRLAIEDYGIPSIVLMENAAVHLAAAARRMMPPRNGTVILYCGPGNNGGDGFALARHLHNSGARVQVVLAAPAQRYTGDAATNLDIIRAMGIDIRRRPPTARPDLIVDALLGTGLDRPVGEPIAGFIRMINRARSRVLAVDIPSGLDADSGKPLGIAVRADVTVTMAGRKRGFTRAPAREFLGRVIVADIGVPRELAERLALGTAGASGR